MSFNIYRDLHEKEILLTVRDHKGRLLSWPVLILDITYWSSASQVDHNGKEMLFWRRPCLSRKTDEIEHHVSSHRDYGDEASSRGASRTSNLLRSSKSKFQVRDYSLQKKYLKTKNKKYKEKSINSGVCAKICGERGRRERWLTSNFERRHSKSKLEVWSSRSNFWKVRRFQLQKVNLIPSLSSCPFVVFLLPSSSETRGDVRQWRWREGEEGETGPRSSESRTSNLEFRTSSFPMWNLQHPTFTTTSLTRSQRLQFTRAIFTSLNESYRDEKLCQVNTMRFRIILVSFWEKRVQRHEWYQWGYILSRELYIFKISCPPVEIYHRLKKKEVTCFFVDDHHRVFEVCDSTHNIICTNFLFKCVSHHRHSQLSVPHTVLLLIPTNWIRETALMIRNWCTVAPKSSGNVNGSTHHVVVLLCCPVWMQLRCSDRRRIKSILREETQTIRKQAHCQRLATFVRDKRTLNISILQQSSDDNGWKDDGHQCPRHIVFIWNRGGVKDTEVHKCHTHQNRRTGFVTVLKILFLSTFTTLNLPVLDGLALSSSHDVTLLPGESTGSVRKYLLVAVLKRWSVLLKCKKILLGTIVCHIFAEMVIPLLIFLG